MRYRKRCNKPQCIKHQDAFHLGLPASTLPAGKLAAPPQRPPAQHTGRHPAIAEQSSEVMPEASHNASPKVSRAVATAAPAVRTTPATCAAPSSNLTASNTMRMGDAPSPR